MTSLKSFFFLFFLSLFFFTDATFLSPFASNLKSKSPHLYGKVANFFYQKTLKDLSGYRQQNFPIERVEFSVDDKFPRLVNPFLRALEPRFNRPVGDQFILNLIDRFDFEDEVLNFREHNWGQEELNKLSVIRTNDYLNDLEERSLKAAEKELNNNGLLFRRDEDFLKVNALMKAFEEIEKLLSDRESGDSKKE